MPVWNSIWAEEGQRVAGNARPAQGDTVPGLLRDGGDQTSSPGTSEPPTAPKSPRSPEENTPARIAGKRRPRLPRAVRTDGQRERRTERSERVGKGPHRTQSLPRRGVRHKSQACSHIAAQAMSARRDTRALPKPTRPALSRPLPTPRGAAGSSCREIPSGASSGDPGAVGKGGSAAESPSRALGGVRCHPGPWRAG